MNEENERLRHELAVVKAQFVRFAHHVRSAGSDIATKIAAESYERATVQSLLLCTAGADAVASLEMETEQRGEYDLVALVACVDPNTASYSETPFEND